MYDASAAHRGGGSEVLAPARDALLHELSKVTLKGNRRACLMKRMHARCWSSLKWCNVERHENVHVSLR